MLMLAVDIHQTLAELAQLRCSNCGAVDEGARTTAGINHPAYQASAALICKFLFLKVLYRRLKCSDIKLRADFGTFRTLPHYHRIRTRAQHQRQRVDQN